jgi:regulator of cell morphogenesis and NO signaling
MESGILSETVLTHTAFIRGVECNRSTAVSARTAPLTELTRMIVHHHHAYVREELPRLHALADAAATACGHLYPEMVRILRKLRRLAGDLTFHMHTKETTLFPHIEALERHHSGNAPAPIGRTGGFQGHVAEMAREHACIAGLLSEMRAETHGFAAPAAAGAAIADLYRDLETFEQLRQRNAQIENEVLFPAAIELERQLFATR